MKLFENKLRKFADDILSKKINIEDMFPANPKVDEIMKEQRMSGFKKNCNRCPDCPNNRY